CRLNAPETATGKNGGSCFSRRRILPVAACDSASNNRREAEQENKCSFHTFDVRQLPNWPVVNNSTIFLLAISRASVINRFNVNSMQARPNHQNGHGSFGIVSRLIRIPVFVDSLSPQRACG